MEDWHLKQYVTEVANQAEAVRLAASDFRAAYQSRSKDSVARMFLSLQSMLGSAAMLSKLLWPNSGKFDERCRPLDTIGMDRRAVTIARGKALCAALDVTEKDEATRPLRSRKLRNAFEHFDTRLDDLFAGMPQPPAVFGDRNVGPRSFLLPPGMPPPVFLRHIDYDAGTASVLDEELEVGSLMGAISVLGSRASVWLKAKDPWL